MRHHISPEQLKEISDFWKIKLKDWDMGAGPSPFATQIKCKDGNVLVLPLLTIGQCIESLGYRFRKIEYDCERNLYRLEIKELFEEPRFFEDSELINVLWEALKFVKCLEQT